MTQPNFPYSESSVNPKHEPGTYAACHRNASFTASNGKTMAPLSVLPTTTNILLTQ